MASAGDVDFIRRAREAQIPTVDAVREAAPDILCDVVHNGHVKILRELREGWGLTADDIRKAGVLRDAFADGYVDVVKHLREEWGLTADDARANDNEILRRAAAQGNVAMLRELRIGWRLGEADACADHNAALHLVVAAEHARAARELRVGWGLTKACLVERGRILEKIYKSILNWASEGNLTALRWLRSEWGLTAADLGKAAARVIISRIFDLEDEEYISAMLEEFSDGWGMTFGSDNDAQNAVAEAACYRYVLALRHFREKWGATAAHARGDANETLLGAVRNYLSTRNVMEELRAMGLTAADARSVLAVLSPVDENDNLRALREIWGLTGDDVRGTKNAILYRVIEDGKINKLRELRKEWGLGIEDLRAHPEAMHRALICAIESSYISILAELREGWGLTASDFSTHATVRSMLKRCWLSKRVLAELGKCGLTEDDF